jgi:hypothetical protein
MKRTFRRLNGEIRSLDIEQDSELYSVPEYIFNPPPSLDIYDMAFFESKVIVFKQVVIKNPHFNMSWIEYAERADD